MGVFLQYLIGVQNWEPLANINWINHALDIFLGLIEMNEVVLIEGRLPYALPISSKFFNWAESIKISHIINLAMQLLYSDPAETKKAWISLFQADWTTFSKCKQANLTQYFIQFFSKKILMKDRLQSYSCATSSPGKIPRENVHCLMLKTQVITKIDIIILRAAAKSPVKLWHICMRNSKLTSFTVVKWRSKSVCIKTYAAMSYEQIGEWKVAEQSLSSYLPPVQQSEIVQEKSRANILHFGQGKYNLWENHWVLFSSKIQQNLGQRYSNQSASHPPNQPQSSTPPTPLLFEHVDKIIGTLKTQFPLLAALSMEMLVEWPFKQFMAPPEEDVYLLISAFLQEDLGLRKEARPGVDQG
ncbi:hypothetical protein VP01_3645g2 [Puccinia sorghi]|uniref:Uncharacterized protein n=1 Tax=Puccinia sorghi TaxID=27349 RepID=A0A0L6UWG4_9BASI|nr:hypothetical protein VP01_3645g2 [Puccinia sorghi]